MFEKDVFLQIRQVSMEDVIFNPVATKLILIKAKEIGWVGNKTKKNNR